MNMNWSKYVVLWLIYLKNKFKIRYHHKRVYPIIIKTNKTKHPHKPPHTPTYTPHPIHTHIPHTPHAIKLLNHNAITLKVGRNYSCLQDIQINNPLILHKFCCIEIHFCWRLWKANKSFPK